jgi:CheY-like chemotaxis protein
MPRMSGPEPAERLAKMRPGLRCLFLSGYSESQVARGLANEASLRKPFTLTDLSLKFRTALDVR